MKAEKYIEFKKGLWTEEEDRILMEYIRVNGKGRWNRIPHLSGLRRSGKSCRLRWLNYLSPNVKRDDFSEQEDDLIIRLHKLLGNRWSLIAGRVPGRTDNQVKNHWNTHLCKKLGLKKQVRKGVSSSSKSPIIEIQDVHTVLLQPDDNSDYQLLQESTSIINIENPLFGVVQPCNGEEEELDADSQFFYNDNDDLFNLNSPGLVDFPDLIWDNL